MGIIFTRALLGLERELFPVEQWAELTTEDAIHPGDFPIIDPHHHLWDGRYQDKGWPVPKLIIKALYAFTPRLLMKILDTTQDKEVLATFGTAVPGVPYMANNFLRDMLNQPPSDKAPSNESARRHFNIVGTVLVESGWSDPKAATHAEKAFPEVQFAQQVANDTQNKLCTGIIGHVPLSEGEGQVRDALEKMQAASPNFRGIRDELACRPGLYPTKTTTPKKAYSEEFRSGMKAVADLGLTYETWIYQDNLQAVQDLALAFPKTTMVLDHCGGPATKGGETPRTLKEAYDLWAPAMKELATNCPNVHIKLSGLGMAFQGFALDLGNTKRHQPASSKELAEAWKPYILRCIECFGVDRCMFASNFPVDKVSASYTVLFNAFKLIVTDYSKEDQKKLFHDNAVRIYNLQVFS